MLLGTSSATKQYQLHLQATMAKIGKLQCFSRVQTTLSNLLSKIWLWRVGRAFLALSTIDKILSTLKWILRVKFMGNEDIYCERGKDTTGDLNNRISSQVQGNLHEFWISILLYKTCHVPISWMPLSLENPAKMQFQQHYIELLNPTQTNYKISPQI